MTRYGDSHSGGRYLARPDSGRTPGEDEGNRSGSQRYVRRPCAADAECISGRTDDMCEPPRQVVCLLQPKQPRSCVRRSGLGLEALDVDAKQDLDAVADLSDGLSWSHSYIEPDEQADVVGVVGPSGSDAPSPGPLLLDQLPRTLMLPVHGEGAPLPLERPAARVRTAAGPGDGPSRHARVAFHLVEARPVAAPSKNTTLVTVITVRAVT